jgi:large subunit ribosomal protein L3
MLKLMGKKRGMMQLFDDQGNAVVCTVIQAEPNIVTQIKTKENDGYNALQLGFEKVVAKDPRRQEARTKKPQRGHFAKAGVTPRKYLAESRIEDTTAYSLGQELGVNVFSDVSFVDATATSKGKGYQGVMKRHNYAGGPASHGSSFHRHAGSTGMRSTPGRGLPGGKKAGHLGNEQVTVQNLKVVMIKEEEHLIVLKGQVPGPRNGLVYLSQSVKRQASKKDHK